MDGAGDGNRLSFDVLLSMDDTQPRERPMIAENIFQQLRHMELSSWSLSIHRRVRDIIGKIKPLSVAEIGGFIGLRTSWLFDLVEREQWKPDQYLICEQGPKFGVILKRLIQRYDYAAFCDVIIQSPIPFLQEYSLWKQTQFIHSDEHQGYFRHNIDVFIVDSTIDDFIETLQHCIKQLSAGGYVITVEPDVPLEDEDTSSPEVQHKIEMFNDWMQLIRDTKDKYEIGFTPLHEGTLVVWRLTD